jgi:hypothetical protein
LGEDTFILGGCALFFVALAYGWIANVVKFALSINDPLTALECLRGVGIIAVPLGIVLGYV